MNFSRHPFITSTQLRTETKDLIQALQKGQVVQLIHRSKIVGIIYPTKKVFGKKKAK